MSIIIVTGPSFIKETSIIAPNSPVGTFLPRISSRVLTKFSYIGTAISVRADLLNEGLKPLADVAV